jgi:hypothetical protein
LFARKENKGGKKKKRRERMIEMGREKEREEEKVDLVIAVLQSS